MKRTTMQNCAILCVAAAMMLAGSPRLSAQEVQTSSLGKPSATARRPGEFRLPEIKTEADVAAMTGLSPQERELAMGNLRRIPKTDGWEVLQNDPELAATWNVMESQIVGLLEGEFQGVPFSPLNLISLVVAKEVGNDYVYSLFAQWTVRNLKNFNIPQDAAAKLAALDTPDSKLWTDDERLVIKFTRASINNEMTDELFNQARAAWGDKKVLRYLSWASYQFMWSMVSNVMDLKFDPKMVPAAGTPPARLDSITRHHQLSRQRFLQLIKDSDNFPGT